MCALPISSQCWVPLLVSPHCRRLSSLARAKIRSRSVRPTLGTPPTKSFAAGTDTLVWQPATTPYGRLSAQWWVAKTSPGTGALQRRVIGEQLRTFLVQLLETRPLQITRGIAEQEGRRVGKE